VDRKILYFHLRKEFLEFSLYITVFSRKIITVLLGIRGVFVEQVHDSQLLADHGNVRVLGREEFRYLSSGKPALRLRKHGFEHHE